jgi:hypothetical protein
VSTRWEKSLPNLSNRSVAKASASSSSRLFLAPEHRQFHLVNGNVTHLVKERK